MSFVIFRARSRERPQLPLPGQFLRRRWLTLCMTMEVKSRTAKLSKCQYCCVCKNYRGKVVADQNIASSRGGNAFCHPSTRNKLLLVARHIQTTGL